MNPNVENEDESESSRPMVTTNTSTSNSTGNTNSNGMKDDQHSDPHHQQVLNKKSILLKGADEQDQDQDQDMEDATILNQSLTADSALQQQLQLAPHLSTSHTTLISPIITPSPFLHHNDSGTADRYRSALQRVNSSPMTDVEAWEAIMNECTSLYRTQLLPELESERMAHKIMLQNALSSNNGNAAGASAVIFLKVQRTVELEKKLDWVESCHGHLIKYFPYSSHYYVTAVEMLMARSALPFESITGGEDDYSYGTVENWMEGQTPLQRAAAVKMNAIFKFALGTDSSQGLEQANDLDAKMDDGNAPHEEELLGMCSSSVELWLLYIRKQTRDARRQALQYHSKLVLDPSTIPPKYVMKLTPEGEDLVRNWVVEAYEKALSGGAAFAVNNYLIWKQYLNHVKSWNVFQQQQQQQQNVDMPEMGGINHALLSRQKELLRSIYQRIVTLPMLGLDGLWKEYEVFERAQSEQLAAALIEEYLPKYQHARSVYLERNRVYSTHELRMGRLATLPVDYDFVDLDGNIKKGVDEEEYAEKMRDEIGLLTKWKRRCAYERTNPERLTGSDLTGRIRQYYKDAACCFLRHIEIWHEWSSWELLNTGGSGDTGGVAASGAPKKRNVDLAVGVLQLGQKHVPDSAFLAYSNAKILEEYHDSESNRAGGVVAPGNKAIKVMMDYCARAGNTLGYILLQSLVRKYQGVNEARAVFSEARRNLSKRSGDGIETIDGIGMGNHKQKQNVESQDSDGVIGQSVQNESASKMVMNRSAFAESNIGKVPNIIDKEASFTSNHNGRITWHLYASHATIEHRVNNSPNVAARVYELGLKKHRSFLSTPQYILQYSNLLLELNDEENLRALLTRAISACEEENENEFDDAAPSESKKLAARRELQRPLWDTMLRFETILAARTSDFTQVQAIEARRHKALYGPNVENVAGGGINDDIHIGAQKTSISETLIRSDGYETSSRIVNGLSRLVDSLEIAGILGQDSFSSTLVAFSSFNPGSIWKDDGCSGQSDASYRRRKLYEQEMTSFEKVSMKSTSIIPGIAGTAVSTGRLSSAKERLAQSAALNPNTSVMAAVQGSPEWLRGMLMLLPATIRNYRGKAPPHMIEMALAALRDNDLPASRPMDTPASTEMRNGGAIKRIRSNTNGDYSSDEDDISNLTGGYGSQFRARQKARLAKTI